MLDYLARMIQPLLEGGANGQAPKLPPDMIAAFLAGGQIGITKWWLDHDMECSPQEMARMHFLIASLGYRWALGEAQKKDWVGMRLKKNAAPSIVGLASGVQLNAPCE